MANPYFQLEPRAFWRRHLNTADFGAEDIYRPKFAIDTSTKIATAGSCFAQHIGRYLKTSSCNLLDVEPAPFGLSLKNQKAFGYGIYSARYGNIYTAHQLNQLLTEAKKKRPVDLPIWQKNNKFYDALRPGVEPLGLDTHDEVIAHREMHLSKLADLFSQTEVFIFTLGLTEAWLDLACGLTLPICPEIVAGTFDPAIHTFKNFSFEETRDALVTAIEQLRQMNTDMKIILTVSPVPLAASASGSHVLSASTYSKSVLRAVSGEISAKYEYVDYFPSYELITGAPYAGLFWEDNFRDVNETGVSFVMEVFSTAYGGLFASHEETESSVQSSETEDDLVCEELLLDAFAS